MTHDDHKPVLYCSFCGKSQHEVRKLVAGPTVFICDECVTLCAEIVRDEHSEPHALGERLSERVLELLEHVPVRSVQALLKTGGLRTQDKDQPYNAREVLEALTEGIERVRTKLNMTPERKRAIQAAEKEFASITRDAQASYDRAIGPIRNRIDALRRGEPLDQALGTVEQFTGETQAPYLVSDPATLTRSEER